MLAQTIASAVKEGLELWKTYIATRQQAYDRKMDKNKRKAIEAGENYIRTNESDAKDKDALLKRYSKSSLGTIKKTPNLSTRLGVFYCLTKI